MKFSEQQIIDINYRASRLVNAEFDEDDLRILLIRLREYFRNQPSSAANQLLIDLGDSVAHSIRDRGALHDRIKSTIEGFLPPNDPLKLPFSLMDTTDIIEALRNALTDCGIVIGIESFESKFDSIRSQIIVGLMAILHGMTFKILTSAYEEQVIVRTEIDFSFVRSTGDLRLSALIPMPNRGVYGQWILQSEVPNSELDWNVPERMLSPYGKCESVRLSRRNGRLCFVKINTHIGGVSLAGLLRKLSHNADTATIKNYTPRKQT